MMRVNEWIATRSGANMTVSGKSEGVAVKLTGCDEIRKLGARVVAKRAGRDIAELV